MREPVPDDPGFLSRASANMIQNEMRMKTANTPASGANPSLRAALLFFAALVFTGCANLETVAPPVAMIAARGNEPASLESGRRIYLENCTRCHVAEPVRDYSAARWPGLIADMAGRSHLSATQRHDVLAYVLAASQGR